MARRRRSAAAAQALIVAKAGLEDAGVVHTLLLEFNGEALSPETLAGRMRQVGGQESVFLAYRGDSPEGLLVLRIAPTISDARDWAEITEMYVRPASRRLGIGKALVSAAVQECRDRGCVELNLLVDPANADAQAFYTAAGFRRDSCAMRRQV